MLKSQKGEKMAKELRYFEDYQLEQSGITTSGFGTRTVTEADLINFACITSDYHRDHLDRHYMANSIYGVRVAHGMLGSSLALGMLALNCPHTVGRDVPGAYLYSFDTNYRKGIKLGDTIAIRWRISEKVENTDYAGFGIVQTSYEVIDQDETSLYDGIASVLVKKESFKDAVLQLKPGIPQEVEEFTPDPEQDYYSEDYPIGKGGITTGRTITEADIINFAGLVGDYNPLYVDAEFAKQSTFGKRIAHPMLVFTYIFGLWARERNKYREPKSNVAGHLSDKATFLVPIRIGDTIRCRFWTASSRVSRSRPEAGITVTQLQAINQREEVVQEGSVVLMIPSREGLQTGKAA